MDIWYISVEMSDLYSTAFYNCSKTHYDDKLRKKTQLLNCDIKRII